MFASCFAKIPIENCLRGNKNPAKQMDIQHGQINPFHATANHHKLPCTLYLHEHTARYWSWIFASGRLNMDSSRICNVRACCIGRFGHNEIATACVSLDMLPILQIAVVAWASAKKHQRINDSSQKCCEGSPRCALLNRDACAVLEACNICLLLYESSHLCSICKNKRSRLAFLLYRHQVHTNLRANRSQ